MRKINGILITILCICSFSKIHSAQDNALYFFGVGKTIDFYNTKKYFNLLKYKVLFPDSIKEKYTLKYVSLGVGLSRMISKEVQSKYEIEMEKSIEDNTSLLKLTEFSPYRSTGAFYENKAKSQTIVIATLPTDKYKIVEIHDSITNNNTISCKEFLVDKTKYSWVEYQNNTNQSPILSWGNDKITYMIFAINGKIEKNEAISISEDIIKFNAAK